MPVTAHKIRCCLNAEIRTVIDKLTDYNRFYWNQDLAAWNDMYEAFPVRNDKKLWPSERYVYSELVLDKAD